MSQNQSTPLMRLHTSTQPEISCPNTVGKRSSSNCRPCISARFTSKDVISVVTLGLCLLLSVLVVTPQLSFAWSLGSKNQIVVIGFLLGIMGICVRSISCTALLAVEARLGDSTLQNFDAIRTDSIAVSHTSAYLRAVLLSLILLPLGLSIGYKQFLGGHSSSTIDTQIPHARYGINYPSLGDYSMLNTATYLWLNAYSGFSAQVNPGKVTPLPDNILDQAAPYGYNVLLLSNSSAAALDLPSGDYMESIRRALKPNETWHISASVNAFVSELDTGLDDVRNNGSFWRSSLQHRNPRMNYHGLTTVRRGGNWSSFGFGLIPEYQNNTGRGYGSCILGMYSDKSSGLVTFKEYDDYSDEVVSAFRKSALRFNVQRRRCSGRWRISAEAISLLSGHCNTNSSGTEVDSKIVEDYAPPSIDCLPNLWPTLNWLGTSIHGDDVPVWKIPSYAIGVAISYWSRSANQMNPGLMKRYHDVEYAPIDEIIVSSRSTLRTNWLLYLILSVQPVLGLLGFLLVFAFSGTPISDGFGTLAILARVHPSSLSVLDDAGLSGKIERPIRLQIQTSRSLSGKDMPPDEMSKEVQYVLSVEKIPKD